LKYWPIPAYIANKASGFEIPDMIVTLEYRLILGSYCRYCKYWY